MTEWLRAPRIRDQQTERTEWSRRAAASELVEHPRRDGARGYRWRGELPHVRRIRDRLPIALPETGITAHADHHRVRRRSPDRLLVYEPIVGHVSPPLHPDPRIVTHAAATCAKNAGALLPHVAAPRTARRARRCLFHTPHS